MVIRILPADEALLPPDIRAFLDGLRAGAEAAEKPACTLVKPQKSNKYHAVKTEFLWVVYDSKDEAARARTLHHQAETGLIRWWHPNRYSFHLGCPENTYRPDFIVCALDGAIHFEDVKGYETPKFKKDKYLWSRYGKIPLHVLTGNKTEIIDPGEPT